MSALTPQQERAALLRGAGRLRVDVAREVGVAPATLSRWSKVPAFEEAVSRARAARSDAPSTPRDVLRAGLAARDDDGIDWRTRVQCAIKLLDLGDGAGASPVSGRQPGYMRDENGEMMIVA